MQQISYTIDSNLSHTQLVIRMFDPLKKIEYLKKIVPSQWIQELKALQNQGSFYFKERQLAVDFYGKASFFYQVQENSNGELELLGKLKFNNLEVDVLECDFLFEGDPLFFIKGIHLKIIGTDVSWKALCRLKDKKIKFKIEEIEELIESHTQNVNEPAVVFVGNAKNLFKVSQEPIPNLILKDKTGAFADLYMDFGEDDKRAFHDLTKTKSASEKSFEQDLLEMGFQKKQLLKSNYYCPLHEVSKNLSFLLDIGWKIFDMEGRELLLLSDFHASLKKENELIEVVGKVQYQTLEVDLASFFTKFHHNERFIELSPHFIGLIPKNFENRELENLVQFSNVKERKIYLKAQEFGLIQEEWDSKKISLDENLETFKEKLKNYKLKSNETLNSNFKGILRPYQEEGVNFLKFLYDFNFHGLLADDMGLGKTIQVLAFLSTLKEISPTLIVLPASLLFNWKLEIERFTPQFKVSIHYGSNREKALNVESTIILTTYHTLRMDIELFKAAFFQCLILDEAQIIKNGKTQIAQAIYSLKAKFRLSITGTPIENQLSELWSQFHFLIPTLLSEEKEYLKEIANPESNRSYLQKLKKLINPFILRRKKEEVAKDLPEKIEQTVFLEMVPSQRKIYDQYLLGIKGSLLKKVEEEGLSNHRMEILEAILRLRQICCHPLLVSQGEESLNLESDSETIQSAKLDFLLQDLQTLILEGRKVLIFSQFTAMLKLVGKALIENKLPYLYLDGSTKEREKVVSSFQNDPKSSLFLVSLKAGGVGLNLTAADYVLLLDPWWNESVENQAINRAHRIGRKETVFAKRYILLDSIEEKIMQLKEKKQKMVKDLFGDEFSSTEMTEDDFLFLLT